MRLKTPVADADDSDFGVEPKSAAGHDLLGSPMLRMHQPTIHSPLKRNAVKIIPTGQAMSSEPTNALDTASLEDPTNEVESPSLFTKSPKIKGYGPRGSGPSLDHMRHKKR